MDMPPCYQSQHHFSIIALGNFALPHAAQSPSPPRWHEVVSGLHIKRFPLTLVIERPDRMRNLELMPSRCQGFLFKQLLIEHLCCVCRISTIHHLCVDVPTHTVLNEHFGQVTFLLVVDLY